MSVGLEGAAIGAGGFLASLLGRQNYGPNYDAIIARYLASRPSGYLTAQDMADAARLRAAGSAAAASQGVRARQMTARSVQARGLQGPAAAALENTANATEAQGREDAFNQSQNLLESRYQSALGFERGKLNTAFGQEMGAAAQKAALGYGQQSELWNSILDATPHIISAYRTPAQTSQSTAGTYYDTNGSAAPPGGGSYDPSAGGYGGSSYSGASSGGPK